MDEAFTMEDVDQLEMDKQEIKAILHPTHGTCIRFTTRIVMPFSYDITSRAMWRFITEEGLISLASSFNVRPHTNVRSMPQVFVLTLHSFLLPTENLHNQGYPGTLLRISTARL